MFLMQYFIDRPNTFQLRIGCIAVQMPNMLKLENENVNEKQLLIRYTSQLGLQGFPYILIISFSK